MIDTNNSITLNAQTESNLNKKELKSNNFKECSFEMLEPSNRPKNSNEKRRLKLEFEQKRRKKIKENNSLSIAYSPVLKRTVTYITYKDKNNSYNTNKDKFDYSKQNLKEVRSINIMI